MDAIARERDLEEPAPVLNRHCQVCDFEPRCRAIATSREDLSLLGNMTEKERARCWEKGITTIAQLSYGYRPRRRRHEIDDFLTSLVSDTRTKANTSSDFGLIVPNERGCSS